MTAIGALLVLAAAVKAALWAHAHPQLALLAAVGCVLLAVGLVRFCREIAPSLALVTFGSPSAERQRRRLFPSCPECGWEAAA